MCLPLPPKKKKVKSKLLPRLTCAGAVALNSSWLVRPCPCCSTRHKICCMPLDTTDTPATAAPSALAPPTLVTSVTVTTATPATTTATAAATAGVKRRPSHTRSTPHTNGMINSLATW